MHHMTFFITFLLLLPQRCEGLLEVIGSPQPILAIVGDDIILPCHLKPAINAASETVEWTRPDLEPRFVHVWRSGQELPDAQHPSYEGRTSLFINELKNGNISLKLSKVRLSDKGKYRCFLPLPDRDSTVELVFGSVSSLTVSISKASSGVVLQCKSEGWYPEPEVLWQDSEGILLSAGSTETIRGPDGLYTVSSRVTVERRPNNMFTCRVTQNNINQTREAHIHVPDELFMVQSSSIVRITICVGVCVVSIVAVVLVVRKYGQNKKNKKHHEVEPDLGERQKLRNDIEHHLLLENQRDGDQPMTGNEKMKLLDNIKAEHDDKLEKKEEEMEHVQQVITTLTEQKKYLKTQRDQIISLQQEDKVQINKNQKKLDGAHLKKIKKHGKIEDLEKRKTAHDDLLKNTETQLESTDALINTMTERKGKLENDKEQIKKYIKETERKREEVHRQIQREELQRQIQREEVQRQQSEEDEITKKHQKQPPEGEDVINNPSSSTNIQ